MKQPLEFDWYALMHLQERLIRLMIDSTGIPIRKFYKQAFNTSFGFTKFEAKLKEPWRFELWELRVLAKGVTDNNPYIIITVWTLVDIITHDMKESEAKRVEAAAKTRNRTRAGHEIWAARVEKSMSDNGKRGEPS